PDHGLADRDDLFRRDRTRRCRRPVACDAMGRGGVAHDRRVDGGHRTDVSGNLWWQSRCRGRRGRDACRLSRTCLDGSPRTPAIAVLAEGQGTSCLPRLDPIFGKTAGNFPLAGKGSVIPVTQPFRARERVFWNVTVATDEA